MYKKRKMIREPFGFIRRYPSLAPEDITKELTKTLVKLKDKYDLETEEVADITLDALFNSMPFDNEASVKKSYFKCLVKQYFEKE